MGSRDRSTVFGLAAVVPGQEASRRAEPRLVDYQPAAAAGARAYLEQIVQLSIERIREPLRELERRPVMAVFDAGESGSAHAGSSREFLPRQSPLNATRPNPILLEFAQAFGICDTSPRNPEVSEPIGDRCRRDTERLANLICRLAVRVERRSLKLPVGDALYTRPSRSRRLAGAHFRPESRTGG